MREATKLTCTLKHHVITGEGDFIPEGTPVQVLGWSDDDKPGRPRIEVMSSAYMYADSYSLEAVANGEDTGAVGYGLFLSVAPESLAFLKSEQVALLQGLEFQGNR